MASSARPPRVTSPVRRTGGDRRTRLRRAVPLLDQLSAHRREDYAADVVAGAIVAIMLVPQAMAFALLAGLPAETGLYAAILPVVVYGLSGSSRVLAVGPVAIVSLLVLEGLAPLAEPGSAEFIELAATLALLAGALQLAMGLLRAGFLVSFLSHPVISGFTSAAAIVIGLSQVKHLLGIAVPSLSHSYDTARHVVTHLDEAVPATVAVAALAIGVLVLFRGPLRRRLEAWGVPPAIAMSLARSGPLFAVALGTLAVVGLGLDGTVAVVGDVPAGLPPLGLPSLDVGAVGSLLPTALAIVFVGYMESVSVGKALAARRRERIDPDRELVALGVADLAAAVSAGYPVTGGFSRSAVNQDAGARSGLASLVTGALVALTVVFLTPAFSMLPQAVLAAVIVVAVAGLVDFGELRHVWRFDRSDAIAWLATFAAVLVVGVEEGILAGAVVALALYLWRASRPHVAEIGRLAGTETYRNVRRHVVETYPGIVLLRVDESVTFPTAGAFEQAVLEVVAERRELEAIVLVMTSVNAADSTGLHTLEQLADELAADGIALHLAAVKGPVRERLEAVGFVDHIGRDRVHERTHDAVAALTAGRVVDSPVG